MSSADFRQMVPVIAVQFGMRQMVLVMSLVLSVIVMPVMIFVTF